MTGFRKNYLILPGVFVGLALLLVNLTTSRQAIAQNPNAGNPNPGSAPVNIVAPLPLPVTGSVGVSGTANVDIVPPTNAFTIPPTAPSVAETGGATPPDPSGTSYAISSITVTNPTASSGLISISAVAFNFPASSCGNSVVNIVARGAGPKLFVPPTATIQLTFPQPFVTAAVTGPRSVWSRAGLRLSV